MDDNVVLGLFNYPTPDVERDGTNEIDIEFAHWGKATNPLGNFTVWPPQAGARPGTHTFDFRWKDVATTHDFDWLPDHVAFQSRPSADEPAGAGPATNLEQFIFQPPGPRQSIPRNPLPVHINLWLFRGQPPKNAKEVEVILSNFRYTAAPPAQTSDRSVP